MHRLLQDYLDELETAGSARQLCQALARIAAGLDLPAFAYSRYRQQPAGSFA